MLIKPQELEAALAAAERWLIYYSTLECRTEADAVRCDYYLEEYYRLKTRRDFAALIKPHEATRGWKA